jgi:DAK2 domain fusion protein YloV
MTASRYLSLVDGAARALKDRKDEVNRLNVFPVPDGDTGTNMSLTMDTVVSEVSKLPADADAATLCQAITHGSLMGARGNSGVILSQILRGLCEGIDGAEEFDAEVVARALERSVIVAFQAVRKPVEGTILTVLRDSAEAARRYADEGLSVQEALRLTISATFESVKRTPELLPVLKENNVVDAGGFGLAVLFEGFVEAATGEVIHVPDTVLTSGPLKVVPVDDWDDTEYLYCTEFLLFGKDIVPEEIHDYVASIGGSELVVGSNGEYRVHVHTDDPGAVLSRMTAIGEVAQVHINNMRRQTEARDAIIRAETGAKEAEKPAHLKPIGFVAVAAGEGLSEILRSLGVDEVVSGGQTMNPSTRDIADAIAAVPAQKVIVLPNNRNIVMAANAAAGVSAKPVCVVPTSSVPQAFSAMLAWDGSDDIEAVAHAMTEAASHVRTGEVTTAIKDATSAAGKIHAGQVIGIVEHEIELVGSDVETVAQELATRLLAAGPASSLTILGGTDLSSDALEALASHVRAAHPGIEVEAHPGGQPLYPVIMSAE